MRKHGTPDVSKGIMARFSLRMLWLTFVLLLWIPDAKSQDVKTMISEAMRQISKTIQDASNVIQQHHGYVKSVIPKMQKMLKDVYNLTSDLEPLNNITAGLNGRLASVETILLHDDESANITNAETSATLEDIRNSIQILTSVVQNKTFNPIKNDFIEDRLHSTDMKIENLKNTIESLTNNFNEESMRNMCLSVIDMSPFAKHITAAEQLLKRYELKLDEFKENSENVSEMRVEQKYNDGVINEIKRQGAAIDNIQNVLMKAEDMWSEVPKLNNLRDLQTVTYQSINEVVRAVHSLNESSQAAMANVSRHLTKLSDRVEAISASAQQSVREAMTINIIMSDITRGLAKLHNELTMKDHKMTEISDDVKKNNKDIRNATSRIRALVSQTISNLEFSLNNTLKRKLEEIQVSMAQKQLSSNLKLASMVEDQMTQLWRQFGDINLQLRANKEALRTLNEHTDAYTSRSMNSMKEVSGELKTISSRTKEIRDSLSDTLATLEGASRELSRIFDPAVVGPKIDAETLAKLPPK